MELEVAVLASGADCSSRGLHIFGAGIDTIGVSNLPAQLPTFALVLRIATDAVDHEETHQLTLNGAIPSGEEKELASVEFKFEPPKRAGREKSTANVMIMVGLIATEVGKHQFIVVVDGSELKRLSLWVEISSPDTEP